MNISSVVVKTLPEHLELVKAGLRESGLCDLHFSDELGRIVITLEGDDEADETAKLKEIKKMTHVASADFSYTYTDEEDD